MADGTEVDLEKVIRLTKEKVKAEETESDLEGIDTVKAAEMIRGAIAHPNSVSGKDVVGFHMEEFDGNSAFKRATGKD